MTYYYQRRSDGQKIRGAVCKNEMKTLKSYLKFTIMCVVDVCAVLQRYLLMLGC